MPLPNINLRIDACGKRVQAITNEHGVAKANIGNCAEARLHINSKLYQDKDTTIKTTVKDIRITLIPKTYYLRDVEVKAFRPIAKGNAEKTVYTVDTRSFLKDTKANEALRFLPRIESDGTAFKILGKQANARLQVDGVEASLDELRSLNATDIERVEVKEIDANDNANSSGVINIIRKKRERPKFYGSSRNTLNLVYTSLMTYNSINYQSPKWELNATAGLIYNKPELTNNVTRSYSNGNANETMHEDRCFEGPQGGGLLKLGFYPSEKLSVILRGVYNLNATNIKQHITDFDNHSVELRSKDKIETYGTLLNTFYNITNTNRLLLKASYIDYSYSYRDKLGTRTRYESDMREYGVSLKSENEKIDWLGGNVSLGWKSTWRQNGTQSTDWSTYSVHQLYIDHSRSIGKHFSLYSILKGETDNLRRRQSYYFLPSARINYSMGKYGSLSANYQRTITRPSIDYMNEDTLMISKNETLVGNTALGVQHNDALSLSYSKQIKAAYLSPTDFNATTYSNLGRSDYASLSLNWTQRLCEGRMNASLILTGDYTNYDIAPAFADRTLMLPSQGFGCYGMLNFNYRTKRSWVYSFWGTYHPNNYGFNTLSHQHPLFRASVSKNFFHDRLGFSIVAMNSLRYFTTSRTTTHFANMHQTSLQKTHYNDLQINITWNFGKQFREHKAAEGFGNDDIELKQ
ncbi:outer membrane beta-barrel protein [Prevotella sp. KH2C16]|uniref:outer membrane beta-barrel protein n=1 Tax=Prevotella sp. KH2C16 TaxID=1855325 RepID=UPI0015A6306F|nr:outer membrane beta-barrel protein [Prevotella sp. KH2C16]